MKRSQIFEKPPDYQHGKIQQKITRKLKKLLVSSRQWVGAAETMICQQSSVLSIH
jgi:hypothetical protein